MKKTFRQGFAAVLACVITMTIHAGIIVFGAETELESETAENTEQVVLKSGEKQYIILEPDDTSVFPGDARQIQVVVDGHVTHGYIQDDDLEFCLLYGMNEYGEKSVYRYDTKEKTMQRYIGTVSSQSF